MSIVPVNAAPVFILFVLTCFLPSFAHADYYKYTDNTGAVCITDSPDSVPPKYRAGMKVVRDATLEKKDRASRLGTPLRANSAAGSAGAVTERQAAAPAPTGSAAGLLSSGQPWLKPALAVILVVCGVLVVRKLSASLSSPLLAKVFAIAFFLGVFVFVYKSYADYVASSCLTVKKKIITMFEKSNRREVPDPVPGGKPVPAAVPGQQ